MDKNTTVEEKALELIDKFKDYAHGYEGVDFGKQLLQNAKQCALICVDEILKTLNRQNPNFEDETYWHPIDFWKQVREAIEKH